VPNLYGLVQGEARRAGQASLSSMSPTIVAKDGKPVIGGHLVAAASSRARSDNGQRNRYD
jgi:gamma-glutamyltranspeptidase